jgi:hypothetical protein
MTFWLFKPSITVDYSEHVDSLFFKNDWWYQALVLPLSLWFPTLQNRRNKWSEKSTGTSLIDKLTNLRPPRSKQSNSFVSFHQHKTWFINVRIGLQTLYISMIGSLHCETFWKMTDCIFPHKRNIIRQNSLFAKTLWLFLTTM